MIDPKKNWLGLCAPLPEEARVSIQGIPFDGGTSQGKGAAEAPHRIRALAAQYMPAATDTWTVLRQGLMFDYGDIAVDLNWEKTYQDVEEQACRMMGYGKFNLFLGGDHSVTIPLQKAFKKYEKTKNPDAKIGIIHFDAHFDLCDNYDGHPWSHANTARRALETVVTPADILFLGVRAAESEELELLKQHPEIQVISATDVFEYGYKAAFERIHHQFKDYDALYFTLDIDVLDPAYAPGTGTPVSGGLSGRQLIELVRLIIRNLPVKTMDIVEVSPPLDHNDITSWAAIRIIQEVFSEHSR